MMSISNMNLVNLIF